MLELLRDPLPLSLGDLRQVALLSKAHRALGKSGAGLGFSSSHRTLEQCLLV